MTDIPVVETVTDLESNDGERATVVGEYRAVPMPVRGASGGSPEYAVVELTDGTEVFLGVYNTSRARRDETERDRYDGQRVRVTGTVHRYMPNVGQGPMDPCLTDIERLEALEDQS